MRRIIMLIAASSMAFAASAQTIDRIYTKDGSVYNGFISEQVPGKQVMIYAENASIVFKQKDMQNQRKDYYEFDRLSESSKEIVRHITDTTSLQLASFEYKGAYYENLYMNEVLDSTIRAHALTPRTYIIPWNDLIKTSRVATNENPYGTRDIVTLKSGERLIGQITAQEISKTMTIRTETGVIRTINVGDILSIMSERISEKHTLWEQTPLLDRLVLDGGATMEGFITSRLMGQHVYILQKYGHDAQQIAMKNIRKYQKTRNRDYKVFSPDTAKVVRLNEREVVPLNLESKEGGYVRKDTLVNTFFTGTELHLSLKNLTHDKRVALYEFIPAESKFESTIKNMWKKEKDEVLIIPTDSHPVYETPLIEEDGFMVCEIVVRKAGKYYLTIDGFNAGLNLIFVNKSEKEKE